MARLFASLLILILVSGCDAAVSEKPMFSKTDSSGAPQLENGVWLLENDDYNCPFDATQRVSLWPACASWLVVRDGQLFERVREGEIALKPIENPILIVPGDIALAQIKYVGRVADTELPFYFFVAFENIGRPPTAPLRSIALWGVMCGARPAETDRTALSDPPGELVRFSGFDEKCRPASQDALRAAALASRPSGPPRLRAIWIRTTLD